MSCETPAPPRRLSRGVRLALIAAAAVAALRPTFGAPAIVESASVGSDPIVLEAELDHQFYREGTTTEIYLQARIRTSSLPLPDPAAPEPDSMAPAAPPAAPVRNIAFVLDRSGSMDGERMQALQAAVTGALDALADRDVVSVVLFGSEVETLVEAQRCDEARRQFARIGPIEPAGGAALYDALSQGAAQVRRFAGPKTIDHLVLVTDGAATKGPREQDDFSRLVGTFAHEGTTVSTIGLGDEFDEDLLAALARIGAGRFQFVDLPARLGEAVLREVAPSRAIVATDAVLTVEYRFSCYDVRSHGARPTTVEKTTVTTRFPQLTAGQELSILCSGTLDAFRANNILHDLVRVRLRWTDPSTGESRELTRNVTARFSPETRDIAEGYNILVYRAAVAAMISEGMQDAIEQLDKGEFRRAVRALHRARNRARDANYTPDDPEIDAMIAQLDTYLAEVQGRGMNLLDRKVLRSGLHNQFDIPSADEDATR